MHDNMNDNDALEMAARARGITYSSGTINNISRSRTIDQLDDRDMDINMDSNDGAIFSQPLAQVRFWVEWICTHEIDMEFLSRSGGGYFMNNYMVRVCSHCVLLSALTHACLPSHPHPFSWSHNIHTRTHRTYIQLHIPQPQDNNKPWGGLSLQVSPIPSLIPSISFEGYYLLLVAFCLCGVVHKTALIFFHPILQYK